MLSNQPQDYALTEKYWNEMSNAARMRLLKEAGHPHPELSARVFKFIPYYIRMDIIYSYQCSLAQTLSNKTPSQALEAWLAAL